MFFTWVEEDEGGGAGDVDVDVDADTDDAGSGGELLCEVAKACETDEDDVGSYPTIVIVVGESKHVRRVSKISYWMSYKASRREFSNLGIRCSN